MVVRLPSDLVADVMRSADPARRETAVAKLRSSGSITGTDFASSMNDVRLSEAHGEYSKDVAKAQVIGSRKRVERNDGETSAYRGFEQMVLRNLFENLLPTEESGSFGGGPSAGIWRSLAADQLAGVYAKSGGVGIQSMLASNAQQSGPRRESEWPYFSVSSIDLVRG